MSHIDWNSLAIAICGGLVGGIGWLVARVMAKHDKRQEALFQDWTTWRTRVDRHTSQTNRNFVRLSEHCPVDLEISD